MTDSGGLVICEDCGTPVAERKADGTLVILSRHHGQRHVTVVSAQTQPAALLDKHQTGLDSAKTV